MKTSKYVIVGCLVAALVIILIPRSHDAQTIRAPRVAPEKMHISFAGTEFIQCMNATNLTLSQNDLTRLHIVSAVLNDPYCCEKEAISEERHACLEENIVALKHMYRILRKTSSDKRSKCYGMRSPVAPLDCSMLTSGQDLNGEIQNLASCVRRMISGIAGEYDLLTKCPGN